MKKTNEFRLTLDARSVNEGFARVAVSAFAAPLDPTLEAQCPRGSPPGGSGRT